MYSHRKYKRFHSKRAFQSYRYPTINIKDILLLFYTKVKKIWLTPERWSWHTSGLIEFIRVGILFPTYGQFQAFRIWTRWQTGRVCKNSSIEWFFLMLTIQTNLDLHNFHFCKKKTSFKKSYLFPLFVVKYQIHYIYLPHSVFQKSLYSE